jgi:hypothetical protein
VLRSEKSGIAIGMDEEIGRGFVGGEMKTFNRDLA